MIGGISCSKCTRNGNWTSKMDISGFEYGNECNARTYKWSCKFPDKSISLETFVHDLFLEVFLFS